MSAQIKEITLKLLKTIIPLVFGILVFVLIFRTLDFNEIMTILKQDVNWLIIALSLPFGLLANIVRAYRWDLLIRPLGYKPRKINLIYAVLGNYGVNLVFPRLGEVWRCTMIKQYEKIPFTKLLGTLITDRLADLVSVFLIVVASFIMNIPYFKSFLEQHPDIFDAFYNIFSSVWLYVALASVVVFIWIFYRIFKNNGFVRKITETLSNVWSGIKTIGQMKERRLFIFYTVLIWLGYYLYFYICFYAFPFTEHLGWNRGLIAFGMSSVAVGIPVQGSIGTWHAMVIAVLMGFGLSSIDAGAFAFCVHTVQQLIFTAAFGLFGVLALPIVNRKQTKI
ncbi:flippase-like domain-containing protein [Bacteroidales bacterium OttesenSCG-928-M11]|nr:flippase-like domain-containing protein [Bacteroidales bacterium OttesenSCG-928-M11]